MNRLEILQAKVCNLHQAQQKVNMWHAQARKVVFTNGCFDILHKGHLTYLAEAANLGDRLIIGVNSDNSVRSLGKGDDRPINAELDRAFLVAGLAVVDAVVVFDESTPKELIQSLQPDILVKGGDYDENEDNSSSKKYIVGRETVLKNGGEIHTIPLVQGYSTTSIVNKINS
ncbi:MAG: D-glycero-beta-D-manno-heptose 1-phosphate adenylyltransferase [Crocinitomicaceae bacterium]